jgi:hypothetical protein
METWSNHCVFILCIDHMYSVYSTAIKCHAQVVSTTASYWVGGSCVKILTHRQAILTRFMWFSSVPDKYHNRTLNQARTVTFPWPGHDADHSPPSSAEVKYE